MKSLDKTLKANVSKSIDKKTQDHKNQRNKSCNQFFYNNIGPYRSVDICEKLVHT